MLLSLLLATCLLGSEDALLSQTKLDASNLGGPSIANGDRLGQSVAVLGDLDGNGYEDVIVGMPYADKGGEDRGAVRILFMGSNGSVVSQRMISDTQGGFGGTLDNGDLFGWSVTGLGDLDGNGVPDAAVGARRDDDNGDERGAVWVLFLRTDGTVASHTKIGGSHPVFGGGNAWGDQFGWSLSSPGDINGDGTPDLSVGLPETVLPTVGWPATLVGDIDDELPNGWEASGVVWNPVKKHLVVVSDDGRVAVMRRDGELIDLYQVGGDLEGVTIKDPNSPLVYLGVENPDSIREFNIETGQLTGNVWHLTQWMTGPSNTGLEALTWADGQFYAGHELSGDIYVFNTGPGGSVSLDRKINSPLGQDSCCGLHYERTTDILYALYRGKRVLEIDRNDQLRRSYTILGTGGSQEGFTMISDCPSATAEVVFGIDYGPVFLWDGYPVNCHGPESLPGEGKVWNVLMNPNGTPLSAVELGSGLGSFSGSIDSGDRFGAALAAPGDLDGDGVPDLVVGAPGDDEAGVDRGAIWVLLLRSNGTVKSSQKIGAFTLGLEEALKNDDQFGWALTAMGDIDGDGRAEIGAASPGNDAGAASLGAVEILSLTVEGEFAGHMRIEDAELGGALSEFDQFGTGIAGDIDLNNDGIPDLVVGAAFDDAAGADRGALWQLKLSGVGPAAVFPFGCDTSVSGSLRVESGLPRIGESILFAMDNPFGTQGAGSVPFVLLTDYSDASYPCGGLIAGLGMSGPGSAGEVLIDLSGGVLVLPGSSWNGNPNTALTVPVVVPDETGLVGRNVYAQGLIFDPFPSSGVEIGLTSALELRFGY